MEIKIAKIKARPTRESNRRVIIRHANYVLIMLTVKHRFQVTTGKSRISWAVSSKTSGDFERCDKGIYRFKMHLSESVCETCFESEHYFLPL